MFSLGNVKERILENKIKRVETSTEKKIKSLEDSLNAMKKMLEDIRKETEMIKRKEEGLEKVQVEIGKSEDMLKKYEEDLRRGEEEIRKGEKEIFEKIKAGGLLQTRQLSTDKDSGEVTQENTQSATEKDFAAEFPDTPNEKKEKRGRFHFFSRGKQKSPRTEQKGKKKGKAEEIIAEEKLPIESEHAETVTGSARSMETPIDKLLEIVTMKGSVRIDQAARAFKVKEKQIDEWARILEEHNLIEIHYPAMGKPILKRKKK